MMRHETRSLAGKVKYVVGTKENAGRKWTKEELAWVTWATFWPDSFMPPVTEVGEWSPAEHVVRMDRLATLPGVDAIVRASGIWRKPIRKGGAEAEQWHQRI